jgi:hypothetical protein
VVPNDQGLRFAGGVVLEVHAIWQGPVPNSKGKHSSSVEYPRVDKADLCPAGLALNLCSSSEGERCVAHRPSFPEMHRGIYIT